MDRGDLANREAITAASRSPRESQSLEVRTSATCEINRDILTFIKRAT
jgi:hypothetical protein